MYQTFERRLEAWIRTQVLDSPTQSMIGLPNVQTTRFHLFFFFVAVQQIENGFSGKRFERD